jgi:hypothetical protein
MRQTQIILSVYKKIAMQLCNRLDIKTMTNVGIKFDLLRFYYNCYVAEFKILQKSSHKNVIHI